MSSALLRVPARRQFDKSAPSLRRGAMDLEALLVEAHIRTNGQNFMLNSRLFRALWPA